MSRIGKKPIAIPSGIEVSVIDGVITVKKGNNSTVVDTQNRVLVAVEEGNIVFTTKSNAATDRAFWGTFRALTSNAVTGLSTGFSKTLEINGVGYKAAVKGDILEMALGYSHPINFEIPKGIEITVDKNSVIVKGTNKELVGQVAANIRQYRKPEPYKGKGIKYSDEKIIRKSGKTSKK